MGSQVNQRDQDTEETNNVDDKHHAFNLRKHRAGNGRREDRKPQGPIQQERGMPELGLVT